MMGYEGGDLLLTGAAWPTVGSLPRPVCAGCGRWPGWLATPVSDESALEAAWAPDHRPDRRPYGVHDDALYKSTFFTFIHWKYGKFNKLHTTVHSHPRRRCVSASQENPRVIQPRINRSLFLDTGTMPFIMQCLLSRHDVNTHKRVKLWSLRSHLTMFPINRLLDYRVTDYQTSRLGLD